MRGRTASERRRYKWVYDHILSSCYDVMMHWFTLPFGGERLFRKVMIDPVEIPPGARVLDITCGTGAVTFNARDKGGDGGMVVGSDLSLGQVRRACRKNRYGDVHFLEADATAAPYPDDAFDVVLVPHAIHEMPRAMRIDVLREARRVVSSGGTVYVLDLDDPDNSARRFFLGLWLGYWLPDAINFENATRRDMVRHGVDVEMYEAGFTDVRKIRRWHGTMQVVMGQDSL